MDVDIVALISLATAVEEEAPRLANDLGMTPYECALMLRAPSPIPILKTTERARTLDVLAKVRSRGHDVIAVDGQAVISAEAMVRVRNFHLDAEGLTVKSDFGEDRMMWSDALAIVRAVHRTRTEELQKTTERKFHLARAAMTGGLLMTKNVDRELATSSEEREQVLYVFRRAGFPFLASQSRVRYDGLGDHLRPSQLENFSLFIGMLRSSAPRAAYDERLFASRPTSETIRTIVSGNVKASSIAGVDLLAHLVAMAITR